MLKYVTTSCHSW